jgi:hypothetical protein
MYIVDHFIYHLWQGCCARIWGDSEDEATDESMWNNIGMIQRISDIFYTLCYNESQSFSKKPLLRGRFVRYESFMQSSESNPGSIFLEAVRCSQLFAGFLIRVVFWRSQSDMCEFK